MTIVIDRRKNVVADDTLDIVLLGSPTIRLDQMPIKGIAYSRGTALLYYLAASSQEHSRDSLAGLLWPESTDDQARKNLRDVLANLRRVLAPYLTITRHTVGLNPEAAINVDIRQFESALESARQAATPTDECAALRMAISLYRGDFLDGVYVANASNFEEWILTERERLRQLALHALHTLTIYARQYKQYLEGIDYATRLLALDPLREETHRQLMLLLTLSGQRSAAIAQYETLRQLLDEELGVEPSDESQMLYEQIEAGEITSTQPEDVISAASRPIYHIPALLTTCIGREREATQLIERLLASSRLLTIVGPGGVGKTTLALHVIHQLRDHEGTQQFAQGIVFVPLAALDSATMQEVESHDLSLQDDIVARIADVLAFSFAGSDTPSAQIISYLQTKNMLLVLDNFEHLLRATSFIIDLLQHAPKVSVLITSRMRLNVRGEQVVELNGLSVPSRQERFVPGVWEHYEALQLFRQIAQDTSSSFEWTDANKTAATHICQLVDGLPLGIELAASLVRLLPCSEIAQEIETNLDILQDTRRDTPERHQSLQAVFDHSWSLLKPAEQHLLRQLAVFRGGFTRAAAEAIYIPGDNATDMRSRPSFSILGLLGALVDSSLMRCESSNSNGLPTAHYSLQEVARQYTTEQLATTADDIQIAVHDRHCRYYLALLAQHAPNLRGSRQQQALAAISQDIENIRSAWRWAIAHGCYAELGLAITGLFYFYEMRSLFQEAQTMFAEAAAALASSDNRGTHPDLVVIWGRLLVGQGWFMFHLGQLRDAKMVVEQGVDLLWSQDAQRDLIFPLNYLAVIFYHALNYTKATQLAQEALALSIEHRDRDGETVARTVLGQITYLTGDYPTARQYCQESLAIEQQLGNRWGMVFNLINLGRVAYVLGEYTEARRQFQDSLAIRHAMGDIRGTAICHNHLGEVAAAQGQYTEAQRLYQTSLALFSEIGNKNGMTDAHIHLGDIAHVLNDNDLSRTHFREVLHITQQTQSLPHTLTALVGIAATLIDVDPQQAQAVLATVEEHPAITPENQQRVREIQMLLPSRDEDTGTRTTSEPTGMRSLPTVITTLLKNR